jgi:hypothetical protein
VDCFDDNGTHCRFWVGFTELIESESWRKGFLAFLSRAWITVYANDRELHIQDDL